MAAGRALEPVAPPQVREEQEAGAFDPNGSKIQPTHSMLVTGPIHNPDGSLKDILLV